MSEALSAMPPGHAFPSRGQAAGSFAFHLWIAAAAAVVLITGVIGCALTRIHAGDVGSRILAVVIVLAVFQALPLYWHRKGRYALRDSSLTVLWAALLWTILPFPVDVAGRLGRAFPLRDALLARVDASMGVNVAAIAQWSSHHAIGRAINVSYALLGPLLVLSFLVPGLAGRATAVKRLLVANLAAFAIGLPIFACMPAIGPWYGEHFAANRGQATCQADALLLREPGAYEHHPAGVICFPSFHVMWAIVCAQALAASFRRLRWPAWILAALIVISTMTTGWHYFADVLGGFALAGASLSAARALVRTPASHRVW